MIEPLCNCSRVLWCQYREWYWWISQLHDVAPYSAYGQWIKLSILIWCTYMLHLPLTSGLIVHAHY